jgi:hypothetical protein
VKAHLAILTASVFLVGCGATTSPTLSKSLKTEEMPVAGKSPNIFDQYKAKGNAKMSQGWTSKFDASGISFNNKRTCTLVTPRHVVMAKHYQRPTHSPVIFHDRQGRRVSRFLIAVKGGYGDTSVGLLNEPVPSNITAYPLLRPSADLASQLSQQYTLITDQYRRIFIHQIAEISGSSIRFKHDLNKENGYRKNLVRGDSGNPSFIMLRGKPVLIETHTTGGPGAGPFYGDARLQAEIARLIKEMDSSYSLRTVAW